MTPRPALPNGARSGADEIMTPADVAKWLQVDERQVQRFTNPKDDSKVRPLPAIKLGHKTVRYLKADVLEWLAEQRSTRRAS